MMSLVLAAGNGTRFIGYAQPKPLLPMPDGRPLLAWVCDQLPAGERVIVAQARDVEAILPWARGARIITISHVTDGPLASARMASTSLHGELLIVHCDVLLDCVTFVDAARSNCAPYACVTFTSADPRYGYWNGKEAVEKRVVSERAISGAFYFRDAATFLARARVAPSHAGVPALLDSSTFCYHTDAVVDVGTPGDYERFLKGVTHAYSC